MTYAGCDLDMMVPRYGFKNSLQFWCTVSKASAPESITGVLDELNEGDQEAPLLKRKRKRKRRRKEERGQEGGIGRVRVRYANGAVIKN